MMWKGRLRLIASAGKIICESPLNLCRLQLVDQMKRAPILLGALAALVLICYWNIQGKQEPAIGRNNRLLTPNPYLLRPKVEVDTHLPTLPSKVEVYTTLPPKVEVDTTLPPKVEVDTTLLPKVEVDTTLPPKVEVDTTLLPKVEVDINLPTLPSKVISGVKKFVLFIGYPRSGHSIIASILDAHPHIVISHEYKLMQRQSIFHEPPTQKWTSDLFNALYQDSYLDVYNGTRNEGVDKNGYTLQIDGLWQGQYDRFVDVIGDKKGGGTTDLFLSNQTEFEYNYKQLVARLPVPVKLLHVVRNPYDMISTATIYAIIKGNASLSKTDFADAKISLASLGEPEKKKFTNETMLDIKIKPFLDKIFAAVKITELIGEENVLTIHSSDLVHDPQETILRMCKFFEVDVPEVYLKVASEKVFTSVSRTRELTEWPEELVAKVANLMKPYKILRRYNFTSD